MLTQVPLPLLPGDAVEIAPGVGLVAGPDGGEVWVHGLVTFAWDGGDEAGRRLAAVQLRNLKAATQAQVADAFGVIPVSVWRWEKALAAGGVAGLVPARKGPRRASNLFPEVWRGSARRAARAPARRGSPQRRGCRNRRCGTRCARPGRLPRGTRTWAVLTAAPLAVMPRAPGPLAGSRGRAGLRAGRGRCRCCRIR